MLSSRRFYVELNNDRSRWRNQKNGLPQSSVEFPILFNIYTNNQPLHDGTRNYVYADDLCVIAQYTPFTEVEHTIEEALDELTTYYKSNSLRVKLDKTQVTSLHLKNREAKRTLEVKRNDTGLENTPHPKYLDVILDRTLSNKKHIHNTKIKVATRNNLMKKLLNSKWGFNASTIRTTALALSYSAAQYACPVWATSTHASKLDPEPNNACRSTTGCLGPTNVEELYLLAGIAPPDIRRDVCARVEKRKQETNADPSLHAQFPAERRLKRECFLSSVRPADFHAKIIRCSKWQQRPNLAQHNCAVNLDESLAKWHTRPWAAWRCLNRLRTGVPCSKEQRKRWKYFNGDITCECGQAYETTKHMLQ